MIEIWADGELLYRNDEADAIPLGEQHGQMFWRLPMGEFVAEPGKRYEIRYSYPPAREQP